MTCHAHYTDLQVERLKISLCTWQPNCKEMNGKYGNHGNYGNNDNYGNQESI